MSEMHRCPADGCPTAVLPERLACAYHWRLLPWSVRRLFQIPARHDEALREAVQWFGDHVVPPRGVRRAS